MYVCSQATLYQIEVEVAHHVQLFATPWTVACRAPLCTGILQARILGWVAIPSSRGSSHLRDQPRSPTLQADSLLSEPPGKPIRLKVSFIKKICGN